MDDPGTLAAAISLVPVLLWLLLRARARRPTGPFAEARRELWEESPEARPIEPGGDPHAAFDRVVDSTVRGFNFVNLGCASIIAAVVIYGFFVDPVTRWGDGAAILELEHLHREPDGETSWEILQLYELRRVVGGKSGGIMSIRFGGCLGRWHRRGPVSGRPEQVSSPSMLRSCLIPSFINGVPG